MMPRYYFHLHNDLATTDEEGRELDDIGAARRAAEEDAREMAARSVQCHGHLDLGHYVEVTDEGGNSVVRVRFGEAVAIRGDRTYARTADLNPD
jgi:hypothetical protein